MDDKDAVDNIRLNMRDDVIIIIKFKNVVG